MPIVKRLRTAGHSTGTITIPKAIIDLLGWRSTEAITITPKGDSIILSRANEHDVKTDEAA